MLKKISWKEDTILSIKLKDDLYTLAQMRRNHLMEFFDIAQEKPEWSRVDLTNVPVIFCVYVAESKIKSLFNEVLTDNVANPNKNPIKKRMLSAIIEPNGKFGASLVELDEACESVSAKIIKYDLNKDIDIEIIRNHELTGMIGSPEKLRARLVRYFECGINWDDAKNFLFQGIQPPSPTK